MLAPPAAFQLDPQTSPEALLSSLQALLSCRPVTSGPVLSVAYDTWDGRLRRAGHLLWTESEDGRCRLHCRKAGAVADEHVEHGAPLGFAWDLPAPLRSQLAGLVGPRRLLPVVELERSDRGLDVLDEQGKIVARVRVPEGRSRAAGVASQWSALPAVLTVDGVRGYHDAQRDVAALVACRPGLLPATSALVSLAELRAALPGPSAAAAPTLRGEMRADAGLQQILLGQLEVLEANQRGVREDIDTEFLHDFRVALRRTRSLLRQIRKVLPDEIVAQFRAEFAWIGRASNELRDLDVFRLWVRDQPDDPGLLPFLTWLERRREAAHARLVADLDEPRFAQLIGDWRAFLEGTPAGQTAPARAAQPLREVVARRIRRAYRRVLDEGGGLGGDAPAAALHALRIRCKQLRYLLDTTAPIHESKLHERVTGALKRLQSALGECNDAHVQHTLLESAAGELQGGEPATLLALGRLQARLDERERHARAELPAHWDRLSDERLRGVVRQLVEAREPPPTTTTPGAPEAGNA